MLGTEKRRGHHLLCWLRGAFAGPAKYSSSLFLSSLLRTDGVVLEIERREWCTLCCCCVLLALGRAPCAFIFAQALRPHLLRNAPS